MDAGEEGCWMVVIVGLLAATIAACIANVADYATGSYATASAVVVSKSYTPSRIGTVVGVGSNGNTVVGVDSSPEEYTLILRGNGDKVFSRQVSPRAYAEAEEGGTYSWTYVRGGIFGWRH